jgi:hypothetical protein
LKVVDNSDFAVDNFADWVVSLGVVDIPTFLSRGYAKKA